jgi:hypothetical protein
MADFWESDFLRFHQIWRIEKMMECASLRLTIRPEKIHFLKFILEGYDGLGVLSTIDRSAGLVEVRYPPMVKDDLQDLLEELRPQLTGGELVTSLFA